MSGLRGDLVRSQKLSVREEKMETRETLGLEHCVVVFFFFFWFSQELNNLTVINFARYAVRRSRNQRFFDEKGTFHDFLTNRQVNFTTEKKRYKNWTATILWCVTEGFFIKKKPQRWVDVF